MVSFLSMLIVTAMVAMGIGATIAMVWMVVSWLKGGNAPMWHKWREHIGFDQLESVERAVNEVTGVPNKREQVIHQFGPASGCLSLLLFIPMQIIVTPIGYAVLEHRKRVLRWRISQMSPNVRADFITPLSKEYRDWLGI